MRIEESEERKGASRLLLRELRSPQNARYLRALHPFRLDEEVPDMFGSLLDQLDEAESRSGPKDTDTQRGEGSARRTSGAVHAPPSR
jgi:hypothetical protein